MIIGKIVKKSLIENEWGMIRVKHMLNIIKDHFWISWGNVTSRQVNSGTQLRN